MTSAKGRRVFVAAGYAAIGLWMVVLLTWAWWTFQPVSLPKVEQPIEILNADKTVTVGEPVVMRLVISKPVPASVESSTRAIVCESGNLITLTSNTQDLPVGEYTIIADSALLPNKIIDGDTCTFVYRVRYFINHIRYETVEYESEPFVARQEQGNETSTTLRGGSGPHGRDVDANA